LDNKLYNITIALAGIVQAVSLVKELAQTGRMDEDAYQTSIYSLFQTDPTSVIEVYRDVNGVRYGLEKLVSMFEPSTSPIQARYMLALMNLQKKVSRSPKMLDTLSQRLNQAKKQVSYFSLTHATVIANLADIYLNTISQFKFRIIIWGSQRILGAPENMEKIRALLLAGVRSSVLWRQVGGSRIQLFFYRSKIRDMAKQILNEMPRHSVPLNTDI
jgi:high frequency lysogenization protein